VFSRLVAGWLSLGLGLSLGGCTDDGGAGDGGATSGGGTLAQGGMAGSTAGGAPGGASSSAGAPNGGASGQGGSGTAGANAAGSGGTGGESLVGPRFIGRFTSEHRFAWSGATIALRFTGTAVSVTLDDTGDNFYDAVVDGGAPIVIDARSGMLTYGIATGLAEGPHEVRVTRRTESFFNPSTFVSFSVPESAWLASSAPGRRIEVIGDSISAGYGIEGVGPGCPFTADTENHSLTYEAVAAKELAADLHTEAWSGIGIYRNNDGTTSNVMPARFPLIIPTEPGTAWDFSSFQPDAVIVNLGTNDFSGGDPGMGFQTAHENFAASLRDHYPTAKIYLAVGPMLSGASYAAALGYLEAVVTARQADGDDDIATLEFATTMGSEGFGCDYHPNEVTHARMAATLVERLRADLGW
jgi:lysophospholipase L1-like esterase